MPMPVDFKNTILEQKKKETVEQIEQLTEMKESDMDTIYNLIFAEKKTEKTEQT